MLDHDQTLQELLSNPRITQPSLDRAPRQQGAYVLWLDRDPPICLKIGIAGPRRGKGLWGRLKLHFSSYPSNSVLARHLAADTASSWARHYDFQDRAQRQRFLADNCFFQAIALPDLTREELLSFERFVQQRLEPKYAGRVSTSR